ncbi:MAG: sugar-transfer associated ATP-grasp domain-containing protein [Bauldia sp.]
MAVRNGLSPRDYYEGGLARCAGDDRLLRTIPYAVYETAVDAVLTATDRGGRAALEDKLAFEERCRAAGLPAVRTERILRDGWAESQEELSAIPPGAYLLKPRIGGQGRGIVGLSFDDRAASSERADFLRRATEHAKTVGGDVLLQHRAANHRDLAGLSSAALATTRIVTIWNERDEPEVVEAFYRTSTSPSAPVDNFHAGGTFYPLDIASGTLREGFGPRFAERPVPLETHPLSGQRMAGRPLPGWSGMSDLALALARVFPDVPIVGWDVGYTPTGPLAVEGNAPPGITPTRQFSTGGLVGTRFLTLVAHHAARWLVAHEPAGSRWRPNALAIPRHQPSGGAPAR